MLKKNYIVLKNMLYEIYSLEANVMLTHNYKTSKAAHQRLEIIMKRECERAMKIDYGLHMLPDTILHIANDEQFQWLLQPELKAIKDGLIYVEDKACVYERKKCKYRGYLNAQGQLQGVGIVTENDCKVIGEWHEDTQHGIAKVEWDNGSIWWTQYKYGKNEGYQAVIYQNGSASYNQFKNGMGNGYGITTFFGGKVYRGEQKNSGYDGYGLMKYENNDEYDGPWKNFVRHGEAVFKEASTGRVERRLYERDKVKEVLEVLEQGQ